MTDDVPRLKAPLIEEREVEVDPSAEAPVPDLVGGAAMLGVERLATRRGSAFGRLTAWVCCRGRLPRADQLTPSEAGQDLAFRTPRDSTSRTMKSGTTTRCSPEAPSQIRANLALCTSKLLSASPKS